MVNFANIYTIRYDLLSLAIDIHILNPVKTEFANRMKIEVMEKLVGGPMLLNMILKSFHGS